LPPNPPYARFGVMAKYLIPLLTLIALPLVADQDWSSTMQKARQELAQGSYIPALEDFRAALAILDSQEGQEKERLETLRLLASAARAAGKPDDAMAYVRAAIQLHEDNGAAQPDELAKDVTRMAMLQLAAKDRKAAKESLVRAVDLWSRAPSADGVQELTAVDSLAAMERDDAEYPEAEALLVRALRAREAAYGPDASELIATVDSLAYVLFGQKKYAEAEPLYKRLLSLWENSAGPEHPMVALTLDKMAEFYAAQQRYPEAEPLVERSLAMRTNLLMASFNQTGRIELMQAKLAESRELYTRAIRIGDDCKVADEVMDPLLRIQARLLRQMNRTEEADAIDARVQAALLRKADREGRLPSPVKLK
jgi:tetratricopeptide (TPR) repeat protein